MLGMIEETLIFWKQVTFNYVGAKSKKLLSFNQHTTLSPLGHIGGTEYWG